MFKLDNPIRRYEWGSETAMAEFFGRTPSGAPEAELWIGAHPDSPSLATAQDGSSTPLDQLVAGDPVAFLGPETAAEFGGRLPFLAKVLAAESPLSLQVHPNLEQARRGYAAENADGRDRPAAQRNYKDANHKPEMIVALSPFEALCGFRSPTAARELFSELGRHFSSNAMPVPAAIDSAADLLGDEESGLRQTFSYLLSEGRIVAEAVTATAELLTGVPELGTEFNTLLGLERAYPKDPGVLISLLLNRVSLAPGQALCLPAGNVHAYLSGLGFEVMASSDNVLRGGLTSKHIDIPEFLKTVDFRPLPVPTLQAHEHAPGVRRWIPPFQEFQVEQVALRPKDPAVILNQNGPVVVLVTQGHGHLSTPAGNLELETGDSTFVPAQENPVTLQASARAEGALVAFAVTAGKDRS